MKFTRRKGSMEKSYEVMDAQGTPKTCIIGICIICSLHVNHVPEIEGTVLFIVSQQMEHVLGWGDNTIKLQIYRSSICHSVRLPPVYSLPSTLQKTNLGWGVNTIKKKKKGVNTIDENLVFPQGLGAEKKTDRHSSRTAPKGLDLPISESIT